MIGSNSRPVSLFLCLGMTKHKKDESRNSKGDLWSFYDAAYKQYQSEVLSGKKNYCRYVNDFISYHMYPLSTDEKALRAHIMHINGMHELLYQRVDLVQKYFHKGSFKREDAIQMHQEFNQTDHVNTKHKVIGDFSQEQVSLITKFVNEASLFMTEVNEETMRDFFSCKLSRSIRTSHIRHVVRFFDELREKGLIVFNWQKLIDEHRLLASSGTGKPLPSYRLSCSLSESKRHPDGFENTCAELAEKVKALKA